MVVWGLFFKINWYSCQFAGRILASEKMVGITMVILFPKIKLVK